MPSIMRGTTDNGLLPPVTDQDGAPFWDYAARGELRIQTCAGCRTPRFPPRPCCPYCQSFAHRWQKVSGRGHIWSFVIAHPPLLEGYAQLAPYNVALIELLDAPGIRLVGNVLAAPDAPPGSLDPARLAIGAAVRVTFTRVSARLALPQWLLGTS